MTVQEVVIEKALPVQFRLNVGCDMAGRTRITGRHVSWPWSLPRGFQEQGRHGPLTILPQAAAAGLLPGDVWQSEIVTEPCARMRLIEAGATAVHGGGAEPGRVGWNLVAGPASVLALCAQPYVLLPGARLVHRVDVTMHPSACVAVLDGMCLSGDADPGMGWTSVLTVRDEDGSVVLRDAQSVGGAALTSVAGLHANARAFGTLTVLAPPERQGALEAALGDLARTIEGGYAACGPVRRRRGVALRLACHSGGALVRAFAAAQGVLDRCLFDQA